MPSSHNLHNHCHYQTIQCQTLADSSDREESVTDTLHRQDRSFSPCLLLHAAVLAVAVAPPNAWLLSSGWRPRRSPEGWTTSEPRLPALDGDWTTRSITQQCVAIEPSLCPTRASAPSLSVRGGTAGACLALPAATEELAVMCRKDLV